VPRGDAEPGAIVVAARILTVIQDSEIQTAQLTPPEYSELDIVEPAPFFNVMGVNGEYLAPRMRFGIDPDRLAAASVGQTDSSVRLHYLLRDGAPAVLGHPVYVPSSASTVTQAAAMPMDDSNVLVVWVEQGASKLEVRGAIANCAEQ
jgi:hypothetical protein